MDSAPSKTPLYILAMLCACHSVGNAAEHDGENVEEKLATSRVVESGSDDFTTQTLAQPCYRVIGSTCVGTHGVKLIKFIHLRQQYYSLDTAYMHTKYRNKTS